MLTTYERHSKRKLAAIVLSIVVIAGLVVITDHVRSQHVASMSAQSTTQTPVATTSVPAPTTTTSTPSAAITSTTTANTSGYKDGAYTATSRYYVPHGDESIQVKLTLSNGTITDASIQNSENDSTSAQFQEDFAAAYKAHVVGKKLSGLQLGTVAGASDTTQGFDDALRQIATKAQA